MREIITATPQWKAHAVAVLLTDDDEKVLYWVSAAHPIRMYMCSTVLSLAAGLPHGLRQGQAVLVLSTEEYSHRVLSKALLLRQEKASGIQRVGASH